MKKGESLTRRTVTTARRTANRESATSSTGPRTKRGKETVAENAVTHGIFARAVLIYGETQAEFDAFHDQVKKGLAPVDEFEQLLIERITVALWRSRRLLQFERSKVELDISLHLNRIAESDGALIKGWAERHYLLDEGTLKRLLKYGTALEKEWIRCYILLVKRREAEAEATR